MSEKPTGVKTDDGEAGAAAVTEVDPPSFCDPDGAELTPIVIRTARGETIEFLLRICRTPAKVLVSLDGERINESSIPPVKEVHQILPELAPGVHSLLWSLLAADPSDWRSLARLTVGGAVRFRHAKSASGNDPVNRGFAVIEVM